MAETDEIQPPDPDEPPPDPHAPWRSRARLALIDLEPEVERMMVSCTPDSAIVRWVQDRGATEGQARGLMKAIRAKWAAFRDQGHETRKDAFRAKLYAFQHWAANRPMLDPETGEPYRNADGSVVVQADLQALAKLAKLEMDLEGFAAPTKTMNTHLNLTVPPVAALSPAERQAEIERLLAKHQAAMAARRAPELPVAPAIDVEGVER